MTVADWATTLSGFLSVLVAIGVATRWVIKKYIHGVKDEVLTEVRTIVAELTTEYLVELKPNHGSSLNDTVKLEVLPLLKDVSLQVAKLEGRFEQHVVEGE